MPYATTRFNSLPAIASFDDAVRAFNAAEPMTRGRYRHRRPVGNSDSARRAIDSLFWVADIYAVAVSAPVSDAALAEYNWRIKLRDASGLGWDSRTFDVADPTLPGWGSDDTRSGLKAWREAGISEFDPVWAYCTGAEAYASRLGLTEPVGGLPLHTTPRLRHVQACDIVATSRAQDGTRPSALTVWSGTDSHLYMAITYRTLDGLEQYGGLPPAVVPVTLLGATVIEITIPPHRECCASLTDLAFLERMLRPFGVTPWRRDGALYLDVPWGTALAKLPAHTRECLGLDSFPLPMADKYTVPLVAGSTTRFIVREHHYTEADGDWVLHMREKGQTPTPHRFLLPVEPEFVNAWALDRKAHHDMTARYGAFAKYISVVNGIRGTSQLRNLMVGSYDPEPAVALTLGEVREVLGAKVTDRLFPRYAPDGTPDMLRTPQIVSSTKLRHFAGSFLKPWANKVTLLQACRSSAAQVLAQLPSEPSRPKPDGEGGPTRRLWVGSATRSTLSHAWMDSTNLPSVHAQQLRWHRWATWFLGRLESPYVRGCKGAKVTLTHNTFTPEQLVTFRHAYVSMVVAFAGMHPDSHGVDTLLGSFPKAAASDYQRHNHDVRSDMHELQAAGMDAPDFREKYEALCARYTVAIVPVAVLPEFFRAMLMMRHSREVLVRRPASLQRSTRVTDLHKYIRVVDIEIALATAVAETRGAQPFHQKEHPTQRC